jgi:hypothetical protein
MPTEVIDLLADMSAERAICLALMVCGAPAAVLLLALAEGPILPERVRKSAAYELAALRCFQARDRAHVVASAAWVFVLRVTARGRDRVVTVLLAVARHIEPKGAGR